jgi:hypothetical protein
VEPSADPLSCPQCGGEVTLPAGERFPVCQFCDTALFVDRSGLVGRFRLPRLVDAAAARQALARWMSGNRTVKDLDRKSRVEGLEPLLFPMWLFRAPAGGAERVFVEPAAPTPIPQLADLELPAGKLEPFTKPAEGAETVVATVPLATARQWLSQRGVSVVGEVALVEVPLWRATYSFAGRSYQALIEASTGSVQASIFPEKAESPYLLVAIVGLVIFTLLGLAIRHPVVKLFTFAVASVPLILAAYWVARRV